MQSEARLAANRANAQHSTGPRTPEGKDRVSQNAVKHGLHSAKPLIRENERETYELFEAELYDAIQPVGAIEEDLFAKLLHSSWCLRRIRELEDAVILDYDDPFSDPEAERRMNSYARHTARFERVYRNALRDLRQLQTDRNLAIHATNSGPITITATTNVEKLLKQTQQEAKNRPSEPEPPLDSDDLLAAQAEFEDFMAARDKSDEAGSSKS
jgi:hypothetical protein